MPPISQLIGKTIFESGNYIPQFTWTYGAGTPSVENISMNYYKFGRVAMVGGRFNITNVGSPANNDILKISMPTEISSAISADIPVCKLITPEMNDSLVVRITSSGFQIVNGAGGGYSDDYIKAGYHGFFAVFMSNN